MRTESWGFRAGALRISPFPKSLKRKMLPTAHHHQPFTPRQGVPETLGEGGWNAANFFQELAGGSWRLSSLGPSGSYAGRVKAGPQPPQRSAASAWGSWYQPSLEPEEAVSGHGEAGRRRGQSPCSSHQALPLSAPWACPSCCAIPSRGTSPLS